MPATLGALAAPGLRVILFEESEQPPGGGAPRSVKAHFASVRRHITLKIRLVGSSDRVNLSTTGKGGAAMAAKTDAQVGLNAKLHTTRADVLNACTRAAAPLGERATISASGARVTVQIRPGLVAKMSAVSPVVAISLRPESDDTIQVRVRIEKYRTLQSRVMLIPIGPKRLVGNTQYKKFLASLEQELGQLVNGRGSVERTGQGQ